MNERLINDVVVGVVFVQGPTEELELTNDEIIDGVAEIQDGLDMLAGFEPDAEVSWSFDYEIVTLNQPIFPTAPWKGLPKSFYVGGLDAALYRPSNQKTYLFKGDQYVRMTGSQMDDQYPKPIAGNWSGLPAAFQSGIDAAFWRKADDKIYMFKGKEYVRLTGTTVDAGFPRAISADWQGLPAAFQSGLDAAFMHAENGKVYMFKGDQCVRLTGMTVDAAYPKPIKDEFKGLPDYYGKRVDAAVFRGDNEAVYLFSREDRNILNTYARFSDVTQNVDSGFPKYMGGLDKEQTEALWRDPAQAELGVGPGADGSKAYVNRLIAEQGADGGVVVFITKYPVYWPAYAHTPRIVMAWKAGNESFDLTVAHEMGHMFGAPDEYAESNHACSDMNGRFFKVPNGNFETCAAAVSMDKDSPKPIGPSWKNLPASFQAGIDAAFFRPSNQKTYMFKGDQYVRLTDTTMDDTYPKPIAGNWKGLPASFQSGIDAALFRPSNGKIYMFKGGSYVRLTETTMDDTYPKPIAGNWKGLPASFQSGIDGALLRPSNGKIYMFKGGSYARLTETTMDDTYPKPIAGNWRDLPASFTSGIDAAFNHDAREAIYLFKGNQFARINNGARCLMSYGNPVLCDFTPAHLGWGAFTTHVDAALHRGDNNKVYLFSGAWCVRYANVGGPIEAGYPKRISEEWQGLPAEFERDIDAALFRPSNGKTYLFKGPSYVRLTGSVMDAEYPKSIAGNWSGLTANFKAGIDSAMWNPGNSKIYMFKDSEYVRLTETTVDATYPKQLSNWKGLPEPWTHGIDASMVRLDTKQTYFFSGRRYLRYTNVQNGPDAGYPAWIDKAWMPFPRG